ncbi:MAG: holo-ACP synthase [Phascolarctobacterium sp.]|nr:holo-ACP synthase [Phascolarctobacterium sp.]
MIIGIGCDIVTIERVAKACAKAGFVERVFTDKEIAYCKARKVQATSSYAARFAAKEAVLKALGTGLREGELKEIEVVNDELGKPFVNLYGYHKSLAASQGVKRIHLSLSHSQTEALAYCIMED